MINKGFQLRLIKKWRGIVEALGNLLSLLDIKTKAEEKIWGILIFSEGEETVFDLFINAKQMS